MQLRSEHVDGVEVVAVVGDVGPADAHALESRVRESLAGGPRGVVLDLSQVDGVADEALDVLQLLALETGCWPRPALAACCAPEGLRERLAHRLTVHPDRDAALANVDDRGALTVLLSVDLSGEAVAARTARQLVRDCAERYGLPRDDLAVVVSELVTNAVRYGKPPVHLELDTGPGCVTVVVVDAGESRPQSPRPGTEAEGGRGLLLVGLLAGQMGVRAAPPGKAVWAELPLA